MGLFQVMTVASDAETNGFLAPSFTLIPTHGWKENMTLEKCLSREEDLIEECIEMYAVNQSELIHDVVIGFAERKSLLGRGISFVEGFAPLANRAKYFTINIGDRITPNWKKDHIFFEFLYNNDFWFYVHDPKFFAMTWMPWATPALQESISVNKTANHYYPIVMTEVKELDLPQDPCNDGEEYNLQVDNLIILLFVKPDLLLYPPSELCEREHYTLAWLQAKVGEINRRNFNSEMQQCLTVQVHLSSYTDYPIKQFLSWTQGVLQNKEGVVKNGNRRNWKTNRLL